MPARSFVVLLRGVVDYAGLFPPAALSMRDAVRNYAEYRASKDVWMLGRFIVPAARLAEFESESASLLPKDSSPWKLSALAGTNVDEDVNAIHTFNARHIGATVDTLEMKATRIEEILIAASRIPRSLHVFVEVPIHNDPSMLIQAVANSNLHAKVRTGGVTPDAFPSSKELARFLQACVENDVPFKATAGLHHPIRAEYNLTYEPNSARGKMFGYLNVILAAAFIKNGAQRNEAVEVLEEESADAFRFDDEGVSWRSRRLSMRELSRVREISAISFGSCSFREPVQDLKDINLL